MIASLQVHEVRNGIITPWNLPGGRRCVIASYRDEPGRAPEWRDYGTGSIEICLGAEARMYSGPRLLEDKWPFWALAEAGPAVDEGQ